MSRTVLKIRGDTVIREDGKWVAPDHLKKLLDTMALRPKPFGYDPDPDHTLAEEVAKALEGTVVKYTPDVTEAGVIY